MSQSFTSLYERSLDNPLSRGLRYKQIGQLDFFYAVLILVVINAAALGLRAFSPADFIIAANIIVLASLLLLLYLSVKRLVDCKINPLLLLSAVVPFLNFALAVMLLFTKGGTIRELEPVQEKSYSTLLMTIYLLFLLFMTSMGMAKMIIPFILIYAVVFLLLAMSLILDRENFLGKMGRFISLTIGLFVLQQFVVIGGLDLIILPLLALVVDKEHFKSCMQKVTATFLIGWVLIRFAPPNIVTSAALVTVGYVWFLFRAGYFTRETLSLVKVRA